MVLDLDQFIQQQTVTISPAIVPELVLHLATEVTPLWHMTEERLKQGGLPPPYWAFAWPGGQGLSRYIIDYPEFVCGKRVLDFAAGCGIAAIAAMKSGAKSACAIDIDPLALAAIRLNAQLNDVVVDTCDGIDMDRPCRNIDVIIAGDVCYQQAMSATIMRWLWLCVAQGIKVLLADPGRAYVPNEGLVERARYTVPTSRDLEDRDSRTVVVSEIFIPE